MRSLGAVKQEVALANGIDRARRPDPRITAHQWRRPLARQSPDELAAYVSVFVVEMLGAWQLRLARDRMDALDRERAQTRATITELERQTGGPQMASADERVTVFASLFRGRPDVFATRWESRTQAGRSGWAPRCDNEWRPGVCESRA